MYSSYLDKGILHMYKRQDGFLKYMQTVMENLKESRKLDFKRRDLEAAFRKSFPSTSKNEQLLQILNFGVVYNKIVIDRKEYEFTIRNEGTKSLDYIFVSGRNSIRRNSIQRFYPDLTEQEFRATKMVMTAIWIGCSLWELDEPWYDSFWQHNNKFTQYLQALVSQVIDTGTALYDREEFEESYFYDSSHAMDNIPLIKNIEYGKVKDRYTGKAVYGLKI